MKKTRPIYTKNMNQISQWQNRINFSLLNHIIAYRIQYAEL